MTAATFAGVGRKSVSRERDWWTSAAVLLLPFVTVVGVAAASGGFNATSFGWTALAFAWFVIIAVTVVTPAWGALDVAWLSVAAASCLFTFASAAWSGSVGTAIDNGQRSLEYLLAITAALLVARCGRISLWLGGLALGGAAVAVYSLATRLFPDRFGAFDGTAGYRLFVPIGYWNALGIFAGIAALIAFGVAVAGRGGVLRVLTRDRARPAHRDAVLHVQPRRVGGARGRTARDVRVEPAAPSSAGRCPGPDADPGCRGADRLSSLRADEPVDRRQCGCPRRAPARGRARSARGRAGRRRGGLRGVAVTG